MKKRKRNGEVEWSARLLCSGEKTSRDVPLNAHTADSADTEAKERAAAAGAVVLALVYRGTDHQ